MIFAAHSSAPSPSVATTGGAFSHLKISLLTMRMKYLIRFKLYSYYSWGLPLVLVGIAHLLDHMSRLVFDLSTYLLNPVQPRLPGRLQAQVRKPSLLVQQQEGPGCLLCSAPWCRCPRELCTLPIYYLWHSHTAQGYKVELPIFVILFTSLFKVDLGVLGWDWKQRRG